MRFANSSKSSTATMMANWTERNCSARRQEIAARKGDDRMGTDLLRDEADPMVIDREKDKVVPMAIAVPAQTAKQDVPLHAKRPKASRVVKSRARAISLVMVRNVATRKSPVMEINRVTARSREMAKKPLGNSADA